MGISLEWGHAVPELVPNVRSFGVNDRVQGLDKFIFPYPEFDNKYNRGGSCRCVQNHCQIEHAQISPTTHPEPHRLQYQRDEEGTFVGADDHHPKPLVTLFLQIVFELVGCKNTPTEALYEVDDGDGHEHVGRQTQLLCQGFLVREAFFHR